MILQKNINKHAGSQTVLMVFKNYILGLMVLWTVLVAVLLLWSFSQHKNDMQEAALIQARATFEKDLVYRRWAASHGGVYAPATEQSPANPHLSEIQERDIVTPSGKTLTLINPAYMTRQVYEMGKKQYGLLGHITSLNLKRPENVADDWEKIALLSFEKGQKEVTSLEKIESQDYMRMMRPMITEQACLKCHAQQGYKVGDVRGGISISVPMAPLYKISRHQMANMAFGHGVLWLLGLVGIATGGRRLKRHVLERENIAKFPSEDPNPVLRVSKEGKLLYANNASDLFLSQWGCPVGKNVPVDWSQIVCQALETGNNKQIEISVSDKIFSFTVAPLVQSGYANLYGKDITENKKSEQQRQMAVEFLCLVNKCKDIDELIHSATEFFQQKSDCQAVGIRLKDGDDYPYYQYSGFPKEFIELENSLCIRDPQGHILRDDIGNPIIDCMCGNVICGRFDPEKSFFTKHGSFWTNCTTELLATTSEADRRSATRNRCNGMGYESVALLPLRFGQQQLGLLQLNDKRKGLFDSDTIQQWENLADQLATAIAKFLAEKEIVQNMEQLERFNRSMVGRELRMTELKKEINDFCDRLGMQKRYNLDFDKEQS